MNKLMIFDLDGVLFETREMHFEVLNKALVQWGFDPIDHGDHLRKYDGLPTNVKLDMLGIEGTLAQNVRRDKQFHTLGWVLQNVQPSETFQRLFDDLHADGWKVAVASNAVMVTTIRVLQRLGLIEKCDHVVSGDYAKKPKPHPDMYYACMNACEATPDTTWIVEDSPYGHQAVAAAKAHLISVTGPDCVDEAVRAVKERA